MAAIDPSILIGVLAILSVLAYVFILRKMKTKQSDSADAVIPKEKRAKEVVTNENVTPEPQELEPPNEKSVLECVHHFGYLGTLPKKSRNPDECLQCCRMTECMSRKKPRKSRRKQVEAVIATDEEPLPVLNKKRSQKKTRIDRSI